jgi:hypothetical protein
MVQQQQVALNRFLSWEAILFTKCDIPVCQKITTATLKDHTERQPSKYLSALHQQLVSLRS